MRSLFTFIIFLVVAIINTAQAKLEAIWSSDFALPGEDVVLIVQQITENSTPTRIIRISNLKFKNPGKAGLVRNSDFQNHRFKETTYDANDKPNGRVEGQFFHVEVSGSGVIECEDLEVALSNGQTEIVKVPPLPVYSTGDLVKLSFKEADIPEFTYYAMWKHNQPERCYEGQAIHASLKILVPRNFVSSDLPTTKSQHIRVGTFQSQVHGKTNDVLKNIWPMRNRTLKVKSDIWQVLDLEGDFILESADKQNDNSYKAVMSLPCSFLIDRQKSTKSGTFTQKEKRNINLKLPVISFNTPFPLPPDPPADFCGLTGKFTVNTTTTATELAINEPINIEITVKGTGVLELMPSPTLRDARNWKIESSSKQIIKSVADETTAVVFTVTMYPIAEVGGIPAFSLSYFDAESGGYETAVSQPIGLSWRETETTGSGQVIAPNAPPPAGTVPAEELTDIYHFMPDATEGGNGAGITLPRGVWYLLYLPGLGIIFWLMGKSAYRVLKIKTRNRHKNKELNRLAAEEDASSFLKGIGTFIESNIATATDNAALKAILNKRDTEVFRPDAAPRLTKEERTAMLKTVRKALTGIITALVMLCTLAQVCPAEDQAMKYYNRGQYSKALKLLEQEQQTGSDTRDRGELLYNIGNCKYRLNKPGEAALYYARALQETPDLAEAKANLDFIQRKEGAILPQLRGADKVFTYLSYPQLWVSTIVCTAILLLCIALKLLLKGKLKHTLNTTLSISLLLSILCFADHVYYSTRTIPDLTATPPQDMAYVTTSTTARTAAIDTAEKVIDLPASTPVRILVTRGNQRYVETFTGIRGWVATDTVSALEPGQDNKQSIIIRFK